MDLGTTSLSTDTKTEADTNMVTRKENRSPLCMGIRNASPFTNDVTYMGSMMFTWGGRGGNVVKGYLKCTYFGMVIQCLRSS